MVKKLFRNKNFLIGSILVGFIVILLIMSFIHIPIDPYKTDATSKLQTPSAAHFFGTDHLGRDVFSRSLKAIQVDFLIGISTMIIGGLIGLVIGLLAGYYGGWVDEVLMRIVDVFITIPGTVLVLLIVAILGRGLPQTIIAISVMNFPSFARIIRGNVLGVKNKENVDWAISIGSSSWRILIHHILPDLIPTIIIVSAMRFSSAIMTEAGLSYLGLGVQQPEASLGNMLTRAQSSITINPWTSIIPGLIIIIIVLGFNLLADGMRDVYNQREA